MAEPSSKPDPMGVYVSQTGGYRAFIPAELPPKPSLQLEGDLLMLHSAADRAIGRLDAATQLLPNPDLFVAMYVRREAVYSSQIEGTQASLTDLLEYEADAASKGTIGDVKDVVNYVAALDYGLDRLKTLPLTFARSRSKRVKRLARSRKCENSTARFWPIRPEELRSLIVCSPAHGDRQSSPRFDRDDLSGRRRIGEVHGGERAADRDDRPQP